jgi:hypothetical protein
MTHLCSIDIFIEINRGPYRATDSLTPWRYRLLLITVYEPAREQTA